MSRPTHAAPEVFILLLCAMVMLCAAVAIPYWFGQAFGYSGAVGRTEVDATAAATLFHCRATLVFRATALLVLCSLFARTLHLHLARQRSWKFGLGRSCTEHLLLGLASWGLLALTGVPASVERSVAALANHFCQ